MDYNSKITAAQLKRKAILYIRQSTMKQVYENTESTIRQYELKGKLVQLGWQSENIITIDCDLGQSGAGLSGRDGFKKLVADVGNNEVGAVACLECSRLSRNSQDWGRLMEICSITKTILIDADGIYDLSDFNDRLLLGLKGTMSEAELHFIQARMRGGSLNKAKRGELKIPLPVGYIYDETGGIVKDPNIDIQSAVNLFFESFRICGSARKMASYYSEHDYKIPINPSAGFNSKEIIWVKLSSATATSILHNPAYAGIYAYGRSQAALTVEGKKKRQKPAGECHAYIKNHHEGYISEDEFEWNQGKLSANNTRNSPVPPVREGRALLQGITICGICGRRMTPHYSSYASQYNASHYTYTCGGDRRYGGGICQCIHGVAVDRAVSDLILEKLTPMAISNAAEIQNEIEQRRASSDNYFILKMERARYEAELARKRYMNVDPSNRLVAFELEKAWNQKISELAKAEEEMRVHEGSKEKEFVKHDISELMSIPDNVREIWNSGKVQLADKKRILRCIIEDVTMIKKDQTIQLGIRFKTGTSAVIELQNPLPQCAAWTTPDEVVEIIRRESESHTQEEIVGILAKDGYLSGKGQPISIGIVYNIMHYHNIPTLQKNLKARGFMTSAEKAAQLNVTLEALHKMRKKGLIKCKYIKTTGRGDYMFEP